MERIKERFKKISNSLPGDGAIVDTVLEKTYRIRSEWEMKKLVESINTLLTETHEKVAEKLEEKDK